MMDKKLCAYMEGQLKGLLSDVEMPDSYYQKAITSYQSLSSYLTRDDSLLSQHDPRILLQGSIKTGTAIRPITEDGSYDVDTVCNLHGLSKIDITQKGLKELVGSEVVAYASSKRMKNRPRDGKRCWTLEYADEASFHIDILPTVDDTTQYHQVMEEKGFRFTEEDEYLAHTDKRDIDYEKMSSSWPITNPEGLARWFLDCAQYRTYKKRALNEMAYVEDIKEYEVKAPLQRYVQLLKRHRDVYFDENNLTEFAPKSIVITVLAGKAYESIEKYGWYEDFITVLSEMSNYIVRSDAGYQLLNPSNPMENFLEGWTDANCEAFNKWHKTAMDAFTIAQNTMRRKLFGRNVQGRLRESLALPKLDTMVSATLERVASLSYHQAPEWDIAQIIKVQIEAEYMRNGGKFKPFKSGEPLGKQMDLRFTAVADSLKEYRVVWQVTNAGAEATAANCLRGDFYSGKTIEGRRCRTESTSYFGKHYVECFLIKDNVCYGKSEPFVVNVAKNI